jgi:fructoselysine-6-P-deglycase FrlB-like protein
MATKATEEIFSQPVIWRQAIGAYKEFSHLLPTKGERVAFVGCGTSWFMSMISAARREELGLGESDAFTASEFPYDRKYDRIVAITRSGTTTEVVEFLKSVKNTNTVVITAVPDSPVTHFADETILIPFADEESVLQTRFATAILAIMRTHYGEDLSNVVKQGEEALSLDLKPEWVAAEQISFLGRGWTVGFAHEAALKTRESSQFWAEAYPAMDYRHGPISVAEPGRLVWAFGEVPENLEADVAKTGATFVSSSWDAMALLVVAQRVAIAIAERKGVDADNPRHLSRSIVLTGK